MSKKPSYAGLALTIPGAVGSSTAGMSDEAPSASESPKPKRSKTSTATRSSTRPESRSGSLRDRTQQVLVYLNPAFHRALRIYAAEADKRVHDLILEALEDLAKKRGIRETPRA